MTIKTTFNTPKHAVTLLGKTPKRLTMAEHGIASKGVLTRFAAIFGMSARSFCVIPSLRGRTSYGDIDIVLNPDGLGSNWQKMVAERIFSKASFINVPDTKIWVFFDNVNLIQYNFHMVDSRAELLRVVEYFRYEGLHVLISFLADNLGLIYKEEGLYIKSIGGKPDLPISQDISHIVHLLGLDMEFYTNALYLQSDSFSLIRKSKYFNRNYFLEFAADESNASLIEGSPILKAFLKDLETGAENDVPFDKDSAVIKSLASYFKAAFPETVAEYTKDVNETKLKEIIDLKYDLKLIKEWTGLHWEDACTLVNCYEKTFKDKKTFNMFILSSSPATIKESIMNYHNSRKLTEEIPIVEETPVITPPTLKAKGVKAAKAIAKKKSTKKPLVAGVLPPVAVVSDEASDNSFALAA